MESYINGETYIKVHQDSCYYVLLDEQINVKVAPKSAEQIRVEEKIKKQDATLKRVDKAQANQEDKYLEGLKGRKRTIFAKSNPSKKK